MTSPHIRFNQHHVACFVTLFLLLAAGAAPAWADDAKDKEKDSKDPKRPSLVLKANPPIAFSPARIVVTAELRGGTDSDAELYCPNIEWEWGDGTKSESSQNCEPFVAGESKITRRWTVSHMYTSAGRYQLYLRLRRNGKIVLAGSDKVEVRPGVRDMSEFDR